MPARKKISPRQLELLVEFAEIQPDIALGRFPAGPQSRQATQLAWESIALKLNAIGEGSTKTPNEWRRYWIEFKARTKSKAADSRRIASSTGGGPNKLIPLNEIEERVLAILGPVAVEGLPGVSIPVEALDHLTTEHGPSTSTAPDPTTISSEPHMEEEWLDESPPTLRVEIQNPVPPIIPAPPQEVVGSSHNSPREHLENPQEEDMPEIPRQSIHDRHSQRSSRSRRTRSLRQVMRDERVPRWAYELETRHIAVQERMVQLLQQHIQMNARGIGLLEEFTQNFSRLSSSIQSYINNN